MTNCKVGELAIVIAGAYPENFGAVVRIVESSPVLQFSWKCAVEGRPLLGAELYSGKERWTEKGEHMLFNDRDLRPISGLPLDEDVKDETKEPA